MRLLRGNTDKSKKKKTKAEVSATVRMRNRTNKGVLGLMTVFCAAVIVRLFVVSVVDNSKYEGMANNYHFGTMTLSANRGAIYDANGTALAWSATVYNIYIDPTLYREEMKSIEDANDKKKSAAEEENETADNLVDVDQLKTSITNFLSEKLGLKTEEVEASFEKDGRYYVLQTQVEKNVTDEITAYFEKLNLSFIGTEATTRRYYPQNELAAAVIGFTNGDGDGQYGLEYQYDDYLSGVDGRVISAQAANGEEMPYRYSTTYDAEDGDSLYLTLDTTIQYYLEKSLAEMVEKFEVKERACGVIMNPKTGAVYAMATYPTFDLNNPSEIYDAKTAQELAALPEGEYSTAYATARETQWKNKVISEISYPGSTFKIVTMADAFEENLINMETDSFYCSGQVQVADATIRCSNTAGHGAQNFTQALTNSCNPAFIEIGQRIGIDKFSYYFEGFGLAEKTGIDLPGEAVSYSVTGDDMNVVDLASAAYGQCNKVTAMELVTAYSAAINGGYMVTPHVVDHVVDSNGNIVLQNETEVKRQIVSEETSAIVREQLEAVVNNNPSHNAYIQGYRIGGKSGTAEKLDTSTADDRQYVASYCCFAPADDPEVIMLIMADEPNKEIGYYGSQVVVPYARDIMEEILPAMGFYPEYSDGEDTDSTVTVPYLQSADITSAESTLAQLGLTYEVVGDGTTVASQSPSTGTSVTKGGKVILYTEVGGNSGDTIEVPNLVGMTAAEVNETMTYYDLNYAIVGSSASESGALVQYQSEEAGTVVPRGTAITLTLSVSQQSD
ncbi:MAG: penicillin-binding transpeptidase domain-containing protein [Ruminococcus sp.]|uniref:penicillin-binding transpeptidase domain-containing protein n=1 Tax=Ruminococcus callidus TaxID=40519 RepID=UPI001D00833C|nr:penicillin-binding transpeptidase domain-containing protein [Ruminococcus callidus]MCB5775126.1 PASTA domain-containing protein [Ruminococcus callidus]MCC2758637.1 PASTA domain-containing protein [Ruminococcus callidus]